MGNLIKNELTKIFKKKGTYIVLIIFFLFVILSNFLYKYMGNYTSYDYRTDEDYIETVKSELNSIDKVADKDRYIECKTDIDFYELYKKYDKDSWQAYIIKRNFYTYLYDINLYKYGSEEDKKNVLQTVENSAKSENVMQIVTSPEKKYNEEISKLNNDDWQSYVKSEIEELTRTNKFFKTTNCVIKCFTK